MSDPALFLIGHGSRRDSGVAQFHAFADAVASARPGTPCGRGLIEHAAPDLESGFDNLVALGATSVVAVPLVLLGAGHMKDDGPDALELARLRHPGVEFAYGRDLGIHPLVLAAAQDRVEEAGGTRADAVVLVGRGSTDPDANADLYKVARLLADARGLGTGGDPSLPLGVVEPAFVSLAPPGVHSAMDRCKALGARSIAVVPYFLFTGVLVERIADQATAWSGAHRDVMVSVGRELGIDRRVVDLVWHRYGEAAGGEAHMNCDVCTFRVPLPGHVERLARLSHATRTSLA